MDKRLKEIKERMKGQDNRATANPIYVVKERRRIYGIDLDYTDNIAWMFDGEEWSDDDPEVIEAEKYYQEHFEEPEDWTRTGYIDTYEWVQPFFSEKAAQEYIDSNKHNLTEPFIYVASAYRNFEWQAVREVLGG